ncbi:MAG: ParA family protein [Thermonemataceae bacterium]
MKIISIVNHKGGVGKTTTTLNLGKALTLIDKKVLIVDIDPQANLSQSIGVENPSTNIYHALCEDQVPPILSIGDHIDLIPSDIDLSEAELKLQNEVNGYFRLKKMLADIDATYDYILIDCPPSLSVLTLNALIASTLTMIIVQVEYLATKGLKTILSLIEEIKENLNPELEVLGLLLTQLDRTIIRNQIAQQVKSVYSGKVFDTAIRSNVSLTEASAMNQDIFTYNPKTAGAEDYLNLAKEVSNE